MHQPLVSYQERLGHPADFEVQYRFFRFEEGGRRSGPPWQHYRSDWAYADSPQELFMIHPEFLDERDQLRPDGVPVPWQGRATMWILIPQYRLLVHQKRIAVGTKGYFMEGNRRVAEATVTHVLGLQTNPVSDYK